VIDVCDVLARVAVPSPFGVVSVLWWETSLGPRVARIALPNECIATDVASPDVPAGIRELAVGIECFLKGESAELPLDLLALETCSDFQQGVLMAESQVPRGFVTTYGRLAAHLGSPRGARAVGNALAHNPFPIVIPCHRAIRSDGALGGFRGGLAMKRALLEAEGVVVGDDGRVRAARLFY
jgi:methylated-DNA-[protein]-cysteine S-methyltransferase